jgi:hypothetical protein
MRCSCFDRVDLILFTPENHTAIGIDDIALASVASGKDPKAMGIFREMAK